jgi:beta-galactosidase
MKIQKTIIAMLTMCLFSCGIKAQELYVGTNYHPHDSNPIQWQKDIELMKAAGFKVVRMGHLAWDSYEPVEDHFTFAWFDQVMDMMNKAGIKVILDIAVRPAPLWLHHKYPGIDITDASGNRLYANHRYMEDIGDPDYQRHALRYADTITKRYAHHPALLAFGIDNESGDGQFSFSESARQRFISWLKKKYFNLDALNKAWASQRWSRRVADFEEIGFPMSGSIQGPPERVMDWRLFESDEINQFLSGLMDKAHANAPGVLTTTNAWYFSAKKYFDYSQVTYSGKMDRNGGGFYPGNSLKNNTGLYKGLFEMAKMQLESKTPYWGVEFTTMTAVPNSIRRSAYATLLLGNQMICGWTWQSMPGGEEQYLEGMTDWDGLTNRKYDEYKIIAQEFKKIEKYGFPYKNKAEIGLAFSFPSQIASYAYPEQHDDQLKTCFDQIALRNIDSKMLNIERSDLHYKLLIMPGVAVIDSLTAEKVRRYVKNGGTVIMTSYSGLVDTHNQVFATTHPGLLSDVFGIRVASYEETAYMNEIARDTTTGNQLKIQYKDQKIQVTSPRFDVIQPEEAKIIASITNLNHDYPVITSNNYGKGTAIYIGIPARESVIAPLIDDLSKLLSLKSGPATPQGVLARFIDRKHILYLNITNQDQKIDFNGEAKSILTGKDYKGQLLLKPNEPEFIEIN